MLGNVKHLQVAAVDLAADALSKGILFIQVDPSLEVKPRARDFQIISKAQVSG